MPPKKAKKISLNEFLGDDNLGSWADEMDALPSAPAPKPEGDFDRHPSRNDYLSSRPDRALPPREDVPLPTQPPYTAFVGNLAFDLSDSELGGFFSGLNVKTVKIIKDKDDKPKGFGYVEFDDLEGLRQALARSGSNLSGRTVRVSVAEPPKERTPFGGSDDSGKFDNPWRRDAPSDGPSRRRDAAPALPSVAETNDDWRASSRPVRPPAPDSDGPPFRRKGSGFFASESNAGSADKEETWTRGAAFKPSDDGPRAPPRSRPDHNSAAEEPSSWRKPKAASPNSSTPPTPQLARKKLELLPKSGSTSVSPSPLSSPKMAPTPPTSGSRLDPFGGARPVDVSAREREVSDRVQRSQESSQEKFSMSRTSSRTGVERGSIRRASPTADDKTSHAPNQPAAKSFVSANVRPSVSFARAAAATSTGDNAQEDTKVAGVASDLAKTSLDA